MSANLPGNPYAEGIHVAMDTNVEVSPVNIILNAIMALTYEQRTANLIGMMRETYDRASLRDKIADRLGWPEGGDEQ